MRGRSERSGGGRRATTRSFKVTKTANIFYLGKWFNCFLHVNIVIFNVLYNFLQFWQLLFYNCHNVNNKNKTKITITAGRGAAHHLATNVVVHNTRDLGHRRLPVSPHPTFTGRAHVSLFGSYPVLEHPPHTMAMDGVLACSLEQHCVVPQGS